MPTYSRSDLVLDKLEAARILIVAALVDMGNGDLDGALHAMGHATSTIESATRTLVVEMRDDYWTWAQIGDQLGITRQSAHERFSAKPVSTVNPVETSPLF